MSSSIIRPDFRELDQIRPPGCSLGDITEANGSCHYSQGNTEAISSVTVESMCTYVRAIIPEPSCIS